MPTIPSPYNFATLEDRVALLSPEESPSHGIPFRDGISGSLSVEFEATRPIYIRGAGTHDKNAITRAIAATQGDPSQIAADPTLKEYCKFYQLPDGRFALPGTSVKGMLRSVLEIASFSRIAPFVQNHRFAIRDLNAKQTDIYKGWMTQNSATGFAAKPLAGWLYRRNGEWHLQPCKYGRIEHDKVKNLGRDFSPQKLASATYSAWENAHNPLAVFVGFRNSPWTPVSILSHQGKKTIQLSMPYVEHASPTNSATTPTPVTLVFTGCPTNKKHREFVFERFNPSSSSDPTVPTETQKDFLFLHEEQEQEDWKGFWKTRFLAGNPVPVFYLATKTQTPTEHSPCETFQTGYHLHSLGLSLMHRLAYARRIHDCIPAPHHLSPKDTSFDLATAIFGTVDGSALRGRISVEPFPLSSLSTPLDPVTAVLNGPKASYFPNYLKQPDTQTDDNKNQTVKSYKTYNSPHAEIRGWKRYPIRPDDPASTPIPNNPPANRDGTINYAVATTFAPLPPSSRFKGSIHFHNLRPWELGALLWALRFGHGSHPEKNKYRHSIGMAKPLGCGTIKLVSISPDFHPVAPNSSSCPSEKNLLDSFESWITQKLGDTPQPFRTLPQIRDLLAMANSKKTARDIDLEYPRLPDFANFKKGDNNQFLYGFDLIEKQNNAPRPPKTEPQQPILPDSPPAPSDTPPPPVALPIASIEITECKEKNGKIKWWAKVCGGGLVQKGWLIDPLPADLAIGKTYQAELAKQTPSQMEFRTLP